MSRPTDAQAAALKAWQRFLQQQVSDGAEAEMIFVYAYLAGWARDIWPRVHDIVPPPPLPGDSTAVTA